MTKLLLAFPQIVLSLLYLNSLLVAAPPIRPTPYFPLSEGNQWVYREGKRRITVKIVKHQEIGDVTAALLEATESPEIATIEYVTANKQGIFRVKAGKKEIAPPFCILQFPPQGETKWKVDSKCNGVRIRGNFHLKEEGITIPAGTYQTLKVSSEDLMIGPQKIGLTYWFAKGVGPVKQSVRIAGVEIVLVLENSILVD